MSSTSSSRWTPPKSPPSRNAPGRKRGRRRFSCDRLFHHGGHGEHGGTHGGDLSSCPHLLRASTDAGASPRSLPPPSTLRVLPWMAGTSPAMTSESGCSTAHTPESLSPS